MGVQLHRVFQEAALPEPKVHLEVPLGNDPEFTRWVYDSISSLLPRIEQFNLSLERLGNLDTLAERLQEEVMSANTVVPWLGLVGASCRKP